MMSLAGTYLGVAARVARAARPCFVAPLGARAIGGCLHDVHEALIGDKPWTRREKRYLYPNVHLHNVYCSLLDRYVPLIISSEILEEIDNAGGFDAYLLTTSDTELHSRLAIAMKRQLEDVLAKRKMLTLGAEKTGHCESGNLKESPSCTRANDSVSQSRPKKMAHA